MTRSARDGGVVAAVFVGSVAPLPDRLSRSRRTVSSAIVKRPVEGPVRVTVAGLAGDEHGAIGIHGTPDRAVLAYAAAHYPRWVRDLGDGRLGPGAFGENLVVDRVAEAGVCVGDVIRVGTAVLRVTQPRRPCRKPDIRWAVDGLSDLMKSTGRTGWLMSVVEEGDVAAGAPFELVERPYPRWTIDEVTRVAWRDAAPGEAAELARCPALAPRWRDKLSARV